MHDVDIKKAESIISNNVISPGQVEMAKPTPPRVIRKPVKANDKPEQTIISKGKDNSASVQEHQLDDLTTAQNENRQTVPIQDACYVLTQNGPGEGPGGEITAKQDVANCVELRLSDDVGWVDNTPGGTNPKGGVINWRRYYQKTGPAIKGKKQSNNKVQKHIFTLNNPYELQVVHYFGEFETKEEYITRMSTPPEPVVHSDTPAATMDVDEDGTEAPPVEMPSEVHQNHAWVKANKQASIY